MVSGSELPRREFHRSRYGWLWQFIYSKRACCMCSTIAVYCWHWWPALLTLVGGKYDSRKGSHTSTACLVYFVRAVHPLATATVEAEEDQRRDAITITALVPPTFRRC